VLRRWEIHKTVDIDNVRDGVLRNEPQLLESLEHTNIVRVFDAWVHPGDVKLATFVMPEIRGGSLDKLLLEGIRLSVSDTIRLGVQMSHALAYLHNEGGFLHRDVKPGNLLLSASGETGYLTDFGSAARLDAAGRTGAYGWQLYYADGKGVSAGFFTPETDIFGLSVALFEACSGHLPFESFDPETVHKRVFSGRRPLPSRCYEAFPPHIPARLRGLLRKGMREDPNGRFGSAAALATALNGLRCIDWAQVDGEGLIGEWRGWWRSLRSDGDGRLCRVTSRPLGTGPRRGELRFSAQFQSRGAEWRRLRPDATLRASDLAGAGKFFDSVDAAVAQVRAAQ
jgi:serine/threonine protein kinase